MPAHIELNVEPSNGVEYTIVTAVMEAAGIDSLPEILWYLSMSSNTSKLIQCENSRPAFCIEHANVVLMFDALIRKQRPLHLID